MHSSLFGIKLYFCRQESVTSSLIFRIHFVICDMFLRVHLNSTYQLASIGREWTSRIQFLKNSCGGHLPEILFHLIF